MSTWRELDTRRGQLLEMAASASHSKSRLQTLLEDYPEEAYGSGWLERAVVLVGRCADEITAAAEKLDR